MKQIIIAGGCFWGVEHYYSRLKGVTLTKVGYTDGEKENPSYQDVCNNSGHVEAVYVEYNEEIISLSKILEHFFRIVDPTQWNRQGHDIGKQYRNGFFYFTEKDKIQIQALLKEIQHRYKKPLHTFLLPAKPFYDAEEYHQKYLVKNPTGYCHVNMSLAKAEELK